MLHYSNYADEKVMPSSIIGNIIPHMWYHKIKYESGRPDHNSISILAEIIYWYRPSRGGRSKFHGDCWQTSYRHFEKKFGYHRETIRRSLVRLEELELIKREFRTIEIRGQKYSNVLFIQLAKNLNEASYTKTIKNKDTTRNFCHSINETLVMDTNAITDKKIYTPIHKNDTPYPQIVGDIYKEEEINKENNRSRSNDLSKNENFDELISYLKPTESVLNQITLDKTKRDSEIYTNQTALANNVDKIRFKPFNSYEKESTKNTQQSIKKHVKRNILTRKKLSEYLPLDEATYKEILSKTKRDFSIEFVTILLKKLSEKYELHSFMDDSYFIKYMTKVLDNELLSEEAANNKEYKKENEYLTQIEDSTDTSRVWRLKRRIASLFDCKTAYRLLTEYNFPERYEEDRYEYQISLKKEKNNLDNDANVKEQTLILSEYYENLLLREVRSIFGNCINGIVIGGVGKQETDSYQAGEWYRKERNRDIMLSSWCNKNKQNNEKRVEKTQKIWERTRNLLIKKYGMEIDKAWFKKLEMHNIEEGREAILQAPTPFIRDWIKNNYLSEIEKTISELVPSIEICTINVVRY